MGSIREPNSNGKKYKKIKIKQKVFKKEKKKASLTLGKRQLEVREKIHNVYFLTADKLHSFRFHGER